MKRPLSPALITSGCLVLFCSSLQSWACSSGPATITNLFSTSDTFQVTAFSSAGDLTGYFYGSLAPHAFLYQAGAVTDLGTFGGDISEGFAINSAGQVVGASYTSANEQLNAFLYSGGNLLNLGTMGGSYSSASLINDAGQIAGDVLLPNATDSTAFLYSNGSMLSLGTLGGTYSSPFALNNSGQIAGESYTINGDTHAFSGSASGLLDLGTLGGNYSSAFGLNDVGMVVGESALSNGDVHAFVFFAGSMSDLGTFGGTYSSAFHVNTNGQVIGIATTAGELETNAFIFTGGSLVDLGTLGGTSVVPYAINNNGQVVGAAAISDGSSHAFLWQKNQLVDLNTLLPANSGWQLSQARFINDSGRIVGNGLLNGVAQWFILDLPTGNETPVAIAGPDQTVDCQSEVTLDGSRSSDPDNDTLIFEWSSSGNVLGTTAVLTVSLPLGTNVVTLKVTDICGASAQTNLAVLVADATPPKGSCPAAVTVSADANCQAALPDFTSQVVATDNCTPTQSLVISQSPAAGTLLGLGQHPVALTVTDAAGNSSVCSVLFTVVDTTPPTILSVPSAFTLSAGANGQAQVPNILANVSASDSCTAMNQLIKSQNPAAGTLVGLGDQNIVVTVSDAAGNSASANVPFKVADTTPPTILSAPSSFTTSGPNCGAVVPNLWVAVRATDNCTPANQLVRTQNPNATFLPLGVYTVVVTVTDASGNSTNVNIRLEIKDFTPPTIIGVPPSFTLAAGADCQAQVPDILSNIVATDSCTPANQLVKTQTPAAGTIVGTGNHSILVTVTDGSGNSSTATVSFTVADTTPPAILSAPSSVKLSADSNSQAAVPNVLGSVLVSDNCTPSAQVALVQSPAPGTVLAHGLYTLTITATDLAGNSSSVTVPLEIDDTTPPVIQSLTASPSVLNPPNHQLVPVSVSATVTDNCDAAPTTTIVSIACSEPTAPGDIQITGAMTAMLAASKGSSGNVRVYTITVQATDAAGNSSTSSVIVTVPKNGNNP